MARKAIPKAVREQLWLRHCGARFSSICPIRWCSNKITVFDFHVGHNVPVSKGGCELDMNNMRPICSRCNHGMGARYTIDEWSNKVQMKTIKRHLCGCLS